MTCVRRIWTDLWWLLFYVAVGLVITALLTELLQTWLGMTTVMLHLAQWLQNALVMLLPALLWVRLYKKERVRETMYLRWPGWKAMGWTLLVMLAVLPLMEVVADFCQRMPLPTWLEDYAQRMKAQQEDLLAVMMDVEGVMGWLSIVALMCVMTAVSEEALFRCALLRCWLAPADRQAIGMGRMIGIALVVGLLFAACHGDVYGLVPRTLLGALFVVFVVRSGSVWPAVMAHALNNLWAVCQMIGS